MKYVFAASLVGAAFAQTSDANLSDSCQGDIELTEYLAAILDGQSGADGVVSPEHAEQIEQILAENAELDARGRFGKVMEACSKGEVMQGRYE